MQRSLALCVALVAAVALSFATTANAQDPLEFWLTDSGVAENLDKGVGPGAGAGTFDIWVKAPVRIAGISLDVTATGDAIELVGAELDNPASSAGQPRWTIALNGTPSAASISAIEGGAFIGLSSQGIGPETAADDAAYNAGLDAFKFATVNYNVVGPKEAVSEISLVIGRNVIGYNDGGDADTPINLGIGDGPVTNTAGMTGQMVDGTITVIPEPSTLLLIGLAMVGLVGACRRR